MKSQDIYHVIGFPVKHSISPKIQMQLATKYNQNMLFTAVEISPQDLEQKIAEFKADSNIKGLSVTVPHKESVYAMCDSADDTAKAVGAASNVIFTADRQMIALNYDGFGIVNDIKNNHHVDFIGKKVLIIGAGGASKAVVAAIINENPQSITIINRTKSKAVDIQNLFIDKYSIELEDYESIKNTYDIIINSTSASIGGQILPITTDNFTENSFAYDLMYAENGTVFTNWCTENGIKSSDGKGMLLELSKAVFKFWRKL
jgi:shikimate dehydrogenase